MGVRRHNFALGEYYHVYNRGVEKRDIFVDPHDLKRFFQSMLEFNSLDPIGSLYEHSFFKEKPEVLKPLVHFIAYCLNPNHYHFILTPVVDKGIEKFMQRFGTGYTKYFNSRYRRSGTLFQDKFKSAHIGSNEYLLHVSAYVNLNNRVHQLGSKASKLVKSSWTEYISSGSVGIMCKTDIVLDQFRSLGEYKEFALSSLDNIIERKQQEKEFAQALID